MMKMYLDPNDRDTIQANLVLGTLTSNLEKLTLTGAWQKIKRNVNNYYPATGETRPISGTQKQYMFSVQSEWSFPSHYLTVGAEYEGDDVNVNNGQTFARVKQDSFGLFAQDEWTLTSDIKATLGLRYSYINGRFVDKWGGNAYGEPGKTLKDSKLVGSVGLVYRGIENWAFRANFSQGYRYPSIRQLFTGTTAHGSSTTTIYPNPDLLPETSINYEIGARFFNDNWDFDISVFHIKAKNYHQSATVNGRSTYVNGNTAVTTGVETTLQYTKNFGNYSIAPYASGTYIHRKVTIKYGARADQTISMVAVPPYEGRVGVKFDADISPTFHFYSDAYVAMASRVRGANEGRASAISATVTEFPAWQNANLNLGIRGGDKFKYHLTLGLRNIFNQQYNYSRGSASLPEAGFHTVLSFGLEY
ncbi:MAG: TonB-dependent receptor [Deltaproteobacteria bacterium]|jgi:outer membrane receptor protein involved in Fe transport|nr:TonB-dependent receptor [Deltaproteobacteria bacterium]